MYIIYIVYIYIYIYIYIIYVEKWFPIVGERLLYKKWVHLKFNNGFH